MQIKRKTNKTQEPSDSRGRKRIRETSAEKVKMEDDDFIEHDYHINIPKSLKDILLDDLENVTKENLLVQLPAKITVTDILDRYSQCNEINGNDEILEQTIQGLKLYFNHTLGTMLLYRSERNQMEELHSYGKDWADLYGGEHLLRLFVELPVLLNQTNVDFETLEILKSTFMDILIFIQDNEKGFFLKDYQPNRN